MAPRGISFLFVCRRPTRIKDGRRRLVQAVAYASWDEAIKLRYYLLAPDWKVSRIPFPGRSRRKARGGAVKHAILLFPHGVFCFCDLLSLFGPTLACGGLLMCRVLYLHCESSYLFSRMASRSVLAVLGSPPVMISLPSFYYHLDSVITPPGLSYSSWKFCRNSYDVDTHLNVRHRALGMAVGQTNEFALAGASAIHPIYHRPGDIVSIALRNID